MTALVHGTQFKPEIVTGQYNSRTGISNVKKSHTRLYFLVGVASEARIEKIGENIVFLILKEI
jgi:hypothetical protein